MWKYSACLDNGEFDYYQSLGMLLKVREAKRFDFDKRVNPEMSEFKIKQKIDAFKKYEFEFVEKFEQLKEVDDRKLIMGVTTLAMEYCRKSPDLVVSLLEDRIIGSEKPGLSMQSMSMIIQVTLNNKIYRDLFDLNIVKTFAHCYKTCQKDLPSKNYLKETGNASRL